PFTELSRLPIASRPPARQTTPTFETIRAIPWMFAWTQNRLIFPAWFGVGQALAGESAAGHRGLIGQMAEEWPFFRVFLSLLEMVLAKASPNIAMFYDARLAQDNTHHFGDLLNAAFEETVFWVKQILNENTLLARQTVLSRSLQQRSAYILPLNFLQAELLARLRSQSLNENERQELRSALLISIMGIAAGMRNTG
ncbi:MAG TPA: phosphoenolpyruvate carboxylase, partial [Gammaproteobacteria bacterium]|nr:phosphoenolpyruvate carboxylase [Gammaproteobacteria bacterium]